MTVDLPRVPFTWMRIANRAPRAIPLPAFPAAQRDEAAQERAVTSVELMRLSPTFGGTSSRTRVSTRFDDPLGHVADQQHERAVDPSR